MIVAYFDRDVVDDLRYAVLKAHPYGLAAAALNFNLTGLTRRVAAACAANYFDDSGVLDFASARGSAQSFLWQAYTLLGLSWIKTRMRHFWMRIHFKEGLAESL